MALRFALIALVVGPSALGGLFRWNPVRLECPVVLAQAEAYGTVLTLEETRAAALALHERLGPGPEEEGPVYFHVKGGVEGSRARARLKAVASANALRGWLVEGEDPVSDVVAKSLLQLRDGLRTQSPPGFRGLLHSLGELLRFRRGRDALPFLEHLDDLCDACLGVDYVAFGGDYDPRDPPGPATRAIGTDARVVLSARVQVDVFIDAEAQKLWLFARP